MAREKPDPRTQPSDADKLATVLIYLRILREPESVARPECMQVQVWNPLKSLAHVIAMPIG